MAPITICPPAAAHGVLPAEPAFGNGKERHRPVSAETCLAFEDYRFAQTATHKLAVGRRTGVPEWATDDLKLRRLIIVYIYQRVYQRYLVKHPELLKVKPTLHALNTAEQKLKSSTWPRLRRTLDNICEAYLEEKTSPTGDPLRIKKLEEEILNVDTCLRFTQNPAAHIATIVHLYYRMGWKSNEVASEIGFSAMHVRQLTLRLNRLWEKLREKEVLRARRREWSRRYKARNREKVLEQNHRYYDRVRRAALYANADDARRALDACETSRT